MFDLNTALFVLFGFTFVDGAVAVLIWNAHRHMPGLAMIAASLLCFAASIWMISFDSIASVTIRNLLLNLSQVLVSEGLAVFLNQRQLKRAPLLITIFTLIYWPATQIWLPEPQSLTIRVIASCAITLLGEGRMIWLILRDRSHSRTWRAITICSISALFIVVSLRLLQAATGPWTDLTARSQAQGWYFLLVSIGVNFLFVCLVVMIGERLSRDLQISNRELNSEIEHRILLQAKASTALKAQLQLVDERKQFLRLLEHEIGTPLAIINRSTEMIEAAPETLATRLETIRNAAGRLERLTNEMLVAERAKFDSLQMAPLDANRVAQEALAAFGGEVDLHLAPSSLPTRLIGDRDMIIMALTNVINNARKFSSSATPIDVRVQSDTNEIRISVEDRGMGFPEDEIGLIGHRQFRASNASQIEGSGLGLHIAKVILDLHQGHLSMQNRAGGGAIVSLHLPTAPQ